jgi:2-polyprenyl-6-methoxyphenol hydroxylase-like FAD-dependent oxidoreductase
VRGFDFFANGAPLCHAHFTTDLDTPYPFILMLPQSETERLLIARLADLGINVERNVTLTGFAQDASGVTATLARPGRTDETVHCRWLVGCDGAHSAVRHALDLPFAGSSYEHTYWLADLHIHWALAHDEVHALLGKRGFLFAFPIPEADRYRLIAQWDESEQAAADPTLADMQQLMDRLGPAGTTLSDPVWLTAFRLHHRKVTRYQEGRVFVAGDAAHIHSPAGGQGMNTGIQDADNLAWKLALVAKGQANPTLLASYHDERNAVGARVLRQTDLMFRALIVRSPLLRLLRNRLLSLLLSRRAFVRQMQIVLSELNIRYQKSPIVMDEGERGGLPAGIRAPNTSLVTASGAATGLWSLMSADQPLQHTLLLFSGPKPAPDDFARLTTIRAVIEREFRDTITVRLIVAGRGLEMDASWEGMRYDDPDLAAHRRYGAKKPALFLIRPDGYIGFRSQPADRDALQMYLRRIFIPAAQ